MVSAILAAGGRGSRLGAAIPKQMLTIGGRSILQRSFDTLEKLDAITEIVVALPSDLAFAPPPFLKSQSGKRVQVVDGGRTRQESVANAFAKIDAGSTNYVLIHDAARPFATTALFERVIAAARTSPGDAAIAAVRASDTVKEVTGREGRAPVITRTIPRDSIYLAQTPQVFLYRFLAEAIERGGGAGEATDEATLVERAGHPVAVVDGEPTNIKITTEQDLRVAEALAGQPGPTPGPQFLIPRVGVGYDLHRLEPGRKLILGGVEIPHEMGLIGHSDADVLCHALTDAILGAACEGDIGRHFPDTDMRWKDADSLALLSFAVDIVRAAGFAVANVDAVVIAQVPKLAPHVAAIRQKLSEAMRVDVRAISVKGKTNESVGALGRNEAIAVHAVALLTHTSVPGA